MKKLFAALLALGLLALAGCGEAQKDEITTTEPAAGASTAATATEAPTTEEPFTLDPNRPMAVMEPAQGGPMLYTFTGKNGKLGLINQDGELVAQPQYEPSNTWNYSAEYLVDVKYSYDANGRVNGITLQKGERGEQFVHYTLDGESRPVEGFPENSERIIDRNETLYPYTEETTGTILDAGKKLLYATKPGEEIVRLYPIPYQLQLMGLVVQDAGGNVVFSVDHNGRPMQSKTQAQFFMAGYGGRYCKLQNGKWTAINLRQFTDPSREGHDAAAVVVAEDYIIVATGPNFESMYVEEAFAVDWSGKRIDDCPLAPFLSPNWFPTAGEQGPNYLWVQHEGKRGYVNHQGEWLFVE